MRALVLGLALALTGCVDGTDGGSSSVGDGSAGNAGDMAPAGSDGTPAAGGAVGAGAESDEGSGPDSEATDGSLGEEACPELSGAFDAFYTEVSGTCGAFEGPGLVPLDAGRGGVSTTIERRLNRSITTEVAVQGCAVELLQTVSNAEGVVQTRIDGKGLAIESDTRVTGQVEVTLFDDAGASTCSGTYDLVLTKAGGIIGSAGGPTPADAGAADATDAWSAAHAEEIRKDCTETVSCMAQRGFSLEGDPIETCIESTASTLDADPARQERFLAVYERCQAFLVCEYVDCASSSP
jgi:hypothetical protein